MRRSLLLAAVAACSCGEPPGPAGPRHVVLITIDTLRGDYVSYSGAGRVETPHLDRLAQRGVFFSRARSPVPLTLPAHASILTGAYPPAHGVRVNGRDRLGDEQTTLAEILKENGYATAAFVSAFVLDRRFGLAQGFDVYDDELALDAGRLESIDAERDGASVASAFEAWLARLPEDRPFFAWLHFYDPHAPYVPPEPYRDRYPEDPYAGEVAYTDAMIGRVVAKLEELGLLERTILAVVSDHGEGLGEHGERTHSVLIYNSTLSVPFLLHAPGLIEPGGRIDALTRTVDVAATLLDYAGLGALRQGRSLRPLVEGAEREEEPVYSESLYASVHLGWSELRGLEYDGFRYIDALRPELYDVRADPGELRNILVERESVAQGMRERLERIEAELSTEAAPKGEPLAVDAETEAMLRSLGYVSSSTPSAGGEAVDPKDKMELWNEIQLGIHELGMRNYEAASRVLGSVLARDPSIPLVYENLGAATMELGRHAEAERIYREALSRGIEAAPFRMNLGLIHHRRREFREAESELRAALRLDPRNVTARVHLGNTLRALGRTEEAIDEYERALEINPRYFYALDGLGIAYSRLGREEEALASFREVVRLDPEGAQGYFNLGVQLEEMGRRLEALESYRELLRRAGPGAPPEIVRRAAAAVERLQSDAGGVR